MNIADLFPQQRRNTHAVLANAETGQSFPDWLRRQMGQLRALGSAQGAERQAAGAVDPEFQRAIEILRIGDYMQAIQVEIALQRLCKPQQ